MAKPDRQSSSAIRRSGQHILNTSYDESAGIVTFIPLALNSDGTAFEELNKDSSGNLKTSGSVTFASGALDQGTGGSSPWLVKFDQTGSNNTVNVESETFTKKTVSASSSGNNTIHTPASGKKIRLYFFGYSAGSSVTGVLAGLRFAAAGTIFDQQYLVAPGQPYARNIQSGKRYVDGAVDEALVLNLSAAQTVYTNVELEEI